jgi:hypothetical protein
LRNARLSATRKLPNDYPNLASKFPNNPAGWGVSEWTSSFGHGFRTGTTPWFTHSSFSRLRCCLICFGEFRFRERRSPNFHFHNWCKGREVWSAEER